MNTLELLPNDMVIIIAKYVYGDDKVVVRRDGHVSFRILKIDPCLFKIPKFSIYLSFGSRKGPAHMNTKSVFLGKKTVHHHEIGWNDDTYDTDENTPSHRRTEYSITIRCDAATSEMSYEFISSVMMCKSSCDYITQHKKNKYLVKDMDRGQQYIKSNRIL